MNLASSRRGARLRVVPLLTVAAAILALSALRCEEVTDQFARCKIPDVRAILSASKGAELALSAGDGSTRPWGVDGNLSMWLNRDAVPRPANVRAHSKDPPEPDATTYLALVAPVVSGEELVSSKAGDRFAATSVGELDEYQVVAGVRHLRCTAKPTVTIRLEVLHARGTIDTRERVIDADFWRVIAVELDSSDLGCGIRSLTGRMVVDLTAPQPESCSETYFRFDGDAAPLDDAPDPGIHSGDAFPD